MQGPVTALSLSPVGSDLVVVSADKSGLVVVWRFYDGVVSGDGLSKTLHVKEAWHVDATINCLKCSPYHADEVAVG